MWKAGIIVALMFSIGAVTAAPTTQPATSPAGQPSSASLADKVLPDVDFEGAELNDVCKYLSEATGANIVLVRDQAVSADYPVLEKLQVKNVTLGQFLDLLVASYDGVRVEKVEGPKAPIFLIRISAKRAPGAAATGPVRLFRLAEAVHSQVNAADEKAALNNVLSLVQEALTDSGDLDACTLKVHESTETLIFQGSERAAKIVAEAIASAEAPSSSPHIQNWPTTQPGK